MHMRVRFVVLFALFAVIAGAAPAGAEECVELGQFKHCTPV
jgi:hypothetical protein